MTNLSDTALCQHLEVLWHDNFPLAKAMGLKVSSYADHELTTLAPLVSNTNIHETAFAGSLYTTQAMTCWGLLYLETYSLGLDVSIIHADGNIHFAKTVNEDILTRASFASLESHLDQLVSSGKTRLTMTAEVIAATEVASSFSGTYLARINT